MLPEDIDALKLTTALYALKEVDEFFMVLDIIVLLLLCEHGEMGKSDIREILQAGRPGRTILDKPCLRLQNYKLIKSSQVKNANRSRGQSAVVYRLTNKAERLLKKCGRNTPQRGGW